MYCRLYRDLQEHVYTYKLRRGGGRKGLPHPVAWLASIRDHVQSHYFEWLLSSEKKAKMSNDSKHIYVGTKQINFPGQKYIFNQ